MTSTKAKPEIACEPLDDRTLEIRLSGSWRGQGGLTAHERFAHQLGAHGRRERVVFDAAGVQDWDSGLLTLLIKIIDAGQAQGATVERDGLPEGVQRLLNLAYAVPEKETAAHKDPVPLLERVGIYATSAIQGCGDMLDFLGEATLALGRLVRGKARFRWPDFVITLQECGIEALPIVSLIVFLNGLILAFVGAIQLSQIGAELFVADLVGIATTREMAAMMAGIVMAGRTGAAFAAHLGTMTANEEIDALETMGISPMEFLVLPRMLALSLMMPLVCLYADVVGILGGFVVGVSLLDLNAWQYLYQTQSAVRFSDFAVGLSKAAVFGALIALSGCMRGMQSGRSASAVGTAATSAVVTAITALIVADAIFAVVTNILEI